MATNRHWLPPPFSITAIILRPVSTGTATTSATQRHQEVEAVMRASSTHAASTSSLNDSSNNNKQNANPPSFRQSLGNAFVAFLAVIFSAQGVRNAHLKRQAELKVQVLEELLEEQRSLLQNLQQPATLQPLAHDCVETVLRGIRKNGNKGTNGGGIRSQWWGATVANQEQGPETSQTVQMEAAVLEVLRDYIRQRIGPASMTTAEKDQEALQQLMETATTAAATLSETQQLQVGTNQPAVLENDVRDGSTTVVKKKVYAF